MLIYFFIHSKPFILVRVVVEPDPIPDKNTWREAGKHPG